MGEEANRFENIPKRPREIVETHLRKESYFTSSPTSPEPTAKRHTTLGSDALWLNDETGCSSTANYFKRRTQAEDDDSQGHNQGTRLGTLKELNVRLPSLARSDSISTYEELPSSSGKETLTSGLRRPLAFNLSQSPRYDEEAVSEVTDQPHQTQQYQQPRQSRQPQRQQQPEN